MCSFTSRIQGPFKDMWSVWEEKRSMSLTSMISMSKNPLGPSPIFPSLHSQGWFHSIGFIVALNFKFRLLMYLSYSLYIFIVPFCYTRIFIFRKNHVMPGSGKHHEEQVKQRRKRNNVTYSSNMLVWLVEALSTSVVWMIELFHSQNKPIIWFVLGHGTEFLSEKQDCWCCHQDSVHLCHLWTHKHYLYHGLNL